MVSALDLGGGEDSLPDSTDGVKRRGSEGQKKKAKGSTGVGATGMEALKLLEEGTRICGLLESGKCNVSLSASSASCPSFSVLSGSTSESLSVDFSFSSLYFLFYSFRDLILFVRPLSPLIFASTLLFFRKFEFHVFVAHSNWCVEFVRITLYLYRFRRVGEFGALKPSLVIEVI